MIRELQCRQVAGFQKMVTNTQKKGVTEATDTPVASEEHKKKGKEQEIMKHIRVNRDGIMPLGIILVLVGIVIVIVIAAFWPNILIGLVCLAIAGYLFYNPTILPDARISYTIAIVAIVFGSLLLLYPGAVGLYIAKGLVI